MTNWSLNIVVDEDESRKFGNHVGSAIVNCGAIEQLTYKYVAILSERHILGTGLGGQPFAKRRNTVVDLLSRAEIDDELRQRAIALWDESKEVMIARNLIAHNPITRVRIDRAEGGEESMMVVLDMKQSTAQEIRHLNIEKIANIANRAQVISEELSTCCDEIGCSLAK